MQLEKVKSKELLEERNIKEEALILQELTETIGKHLLHQVL